MDITKLSKLPESNTLEFKRDASSLDPILKSVVAFANTAGGIILIGIDDDGSIIGLDKPDHVQEQVTNAIAHRIRPQILVDLYVENIKGKLILVIQVDYFPTPYYLSNKGENDGVYIRLGSTNRLASKEMIAEIKRAHQHPFFDKSPCNEASGQDLDVKLIHKVFSNHRIQIDTTKLLSIGILTKKGRHTVATNGGVILFGKPEIRQMYFPFAEVRCARFAGATRAEFIDRLEIEGGIRSRTPALCLQV
jgi:predicted HTH transcriptional regulator